MMDILGGGLVRKDGRVYSDELERVVAFAFGELIDNNELYDELFEILSEEEWGYEIEHSEAFSCPEFDEYVYIMNSDAYEDVPEEVQTARDRVMYQCIYELIDLVTTDNYGYVYSLPFDVMDKLMPNFNEDTFLANFNTDYKGEILLADLMDYLESKYGEKKVTETAIKICMDRIPKYL